MLLIACIILRDTLYKAYHGLSDVKPFDVPSFLPGLLSTFAASMVKGKTKCGTAVHICSKGCAFAGGGAGGNGHVWRPKLH